MLPVRGTVRIFYALLQAASDRLHPPRDLISLTLCDLQGYVDLHLVATIFLIGSWLVLRSCDRKFFVFYATNPNSGIRAVSMHRLVARVEHNGFVGVDAFVVFSSCTLHLAGWWDEAARANFT